MHKQDWYAIEIERKITKTSILSSSERREVRCIDGSKLRQTAKWKQIYQINHDVHEACDLNVQLCFRSAEEKKRERERERERERKKKHKTKPSDLCGAIRRL